MAASTPKCKQPLLLEFTVTLIALAYFIQDQQPILSSKTACTAITFTATHVRSSTFAEIVNLLQGKHSPKPQLGTDKRCLAILLILLSGDIHLSLALEIDPFSRVVPVTHRSPGLRKEFAVTTAVYGIINHVRTSHQEICHTYVAQVSSGIAVNMTHQRRQFHV